MEYPFEFKELLITSMVLDTLGFSEYWAGCGDFGERGIYSEERHSDGGLKWAYRLIEEDEMIDSESGYGYGAPEYSSGKFHSPFNGKRFRDIYFLHDLYDDIKDNCPDALDFFTEKTKQKGVNMYPYIKSYLDYMQSKEQKAQASVATGDAQRTEP